MEKQLEVPPITVLTSDALSECLGYHRCPRNWGQSHMLGPSEQGKDFWVGQG